MLGSIAIIAKKLDADKKAQLFNDRQAKRNAFWDGASERQAAQEKEERERLARNTKQLLDRERHHRRRHKSATIVQARFRGLIVRRNTVHRIRHHHKMWRDWTVRKVFNFYVKRQCELESSKERMFRTQFKKYTRARRILSKTTASQLTKLLEEGKVNRDELGPILDFDEESLNRARSLYLDKHVMIETEQECQEEGFSFRDCLLAFMKHPEHDLFHYHSQALSFSYLLVMLRDCGLLDNSTTLLWLQDCYISRSVAAPERSSRDEVSYKCAYREFIETRRDEDRDYRRARKGKCKYDDVTQPTTDELIQFFKEVGCQKDLSMEVLNFVEENSRKGINESVFATFCVQNEVLDQLTVDAKMAAQIAEENDSAEQDPIIAQIKIILNRHSSFALRFAGFEDTLIHLARHQNKRRQEMIKAGLIEPDSIKQYRLRSWSNTYGEEEDEDESSSDDDESAAETRARHHLENTIVRVHLAPTMHAISKTAVCGATSELGRCLMQSNRYTGYLLRYERNLRSVFIYYSTQSWLRDLNKRKKWSDVVAENHRLSYVDFVRFANEFNMYPQLLSNNMNSARGFQLLNVFLGAKQGGRADSDHRCDFSLHNQPTQNPIAEHTKAFYCEICGSREFIFPRVVQIRITSGVDDIICASEKKSFWSKPLTDSIRALMLKIGDDPTDSEVFYVAREAEESFEQLRLIRQSLVEAEKEEALRINKEERVAREAAQKEEELMQRIKDDQTSEEAAEKERNRKRKENAGEVDDPWASASNKVNEGRRSSHDQKHKKKNKSRRDRRRSSEENEKTNREQKDGSDNNSDATDGNQDQDGSREQSKNENQEGNHEKEGQESLQKGKKQPASLVRLKKMKIKLEKMSKVFQRNVHTGLCRARELKVRILTTRLSFPEFTHCLVLCAHEAFSHFTNEHNDWEEPMRELFRMMDPSFATKFGRKIDVDTKDRVKSDRDLKNYGDSFHKQLLRLFAHYEYSTKSFNSLSYGARRKNFDGQTFLSPSAFFLLVQDCRLCKSVSQAGVMAAYEAATSDSPGNMMTSNVFVEAMEALMYQDFVETGRAGNNPLAYIAPITRATTMTPRGLAIRKAVSKLATLFGLYGPAARTTTIKPGAYAQVFQHVKQNTSKTKTTREQNSVEKLAVCYKNAAKAVIDDDDERIYEATDKLKGVVASLRGVKSYWKLLQSASSVAGAVNALPSFMKKIGKLKVAATGGKDGKGKIQHGMGSSKEEMNAFGSPKRPSDASYRPGVIQMSPKARKNGQKMRDRQRDILSRRESYYKSISETLGESTIKVTGSNKLLSTNSHLFSLTQLSSTMNKSLFAELSPHRPRRPHTKTPATDPYLASVRRQVSRSKSKRLHQSQKAHEMSSMAFTIAKAAEAAGVKPLKEEVNSEDYFGHILSCIKRGLSLKSTKDFDNARKEFQRALVEVDQMVSEENNLKEKMMKEPMSATIQKRNRLMVVILSALCQTDAASQDSDQALVHGERALSICRAMSDPKSTISVLGTIANTHASMNNIKTAVQIHKEQMHLAHRTGNELSALPCYADIARSYALVQDYDNAIRQASHRLDLAKKSNSQFEIALALHDLGKLQLKCGSFKRGLKNLEQCVHLHKSDSVHQATAAIEIGHVYCRTYGEHEKGLYWHTMGMKCAKKCQNSKYAKSEALAGMAECKMGLAAIVARQTRSGYADSVVVQLKKEASECFSQRKTLSMTLGHLDEACRADIQLGLLFQSTGENKKATESFRSAVALATATATTATATTATATTSTTTTTTTTTNTTAGSKSVLLDALVEYGQHALRTMLPDGGDGHAHLERAVSCAKDLGRQDVLCEVLQIIGRWEHGKGRVDSALARAKESAALAVSLRDPARMSGASCLEGICHLSLNDTSAAVVCFKRQITSTTLTGDQVGRTQALDGLTESYTRLEQFGKAAETAGECLRLMEGMEDCAGEIGMRFKFGVILFHLKRYKHAVENYKRILELAARVADVDAGKNANLCLSRVMEEAGSELL